MATLTSDRPISSSRGDAPKAHLFVVLSSTAPMDGGSRHLLEDVDEVHLGRGATRLAQRAHDADRRVLRLSLPDDRVSTAHARLVRGPAGWTFEDLGSKNGSFHNGARVKTAALGDGDRLQTGHTLLVFRASLPTPPGASPDLEVSARGSAFATLLPALARDFDGLARVARTDMPVLLVSETGTGKEVVARALHALSGRAGAFVPVNCGALTQTLAESTLFGHKRGAFSGATADQPGLVRSADGGTLLLDELGDMPLALQPTLLRALQEGEVLPVGATKTVKIDVRFLGATHRDLEAEVATGAFREDLLARLAGFVFELPPLRERREDIGLLVGALLKQVRGAGATPPKLSVEAAALLVAYDWPRNVRELEKCLTRAALFAGDGPIEPTHLPEEVRRGERAEPRRQAPRDAKETPRDASTRARLVELLQEHRGNVQAVADALSTSRSQVHRWIQRFGIDLASFRT